MPKRERKKFTKEQALAYKKQKQKTKTPVAVAKAVAKIKNEVKSIKRSRRNEIPRTSYKAPKTRAAHGILSGDSSLVSGRDEFPLVSNITGITKGAILFSVSLNPKNFINSNLAGLATTYNKFGWKKLKIRLNSENGGLTSGAWALAVDYDPESVWTTFTSCANITAHRHKIAQVFKNGGIKYDKNEEIVRWFAVEDVSGEVR